jgi:hypothetical protein
MPFDPFPGMRMGVAILMGLVLTGCAAARPERVVEKPQPRPVQRHATSAALVFDTPLTLADPPLYLAREPRQPAAVFGYEETHIQYHWVRQDDRFANDWTDRFERRAITVRQGVSYR